MEKLHKDFQELGVSTTLSRVLNAKRKEDGTLIVI